MAKTHYFPSDQVHFTWDAGNAPVLTVDSGDTVVVQTRDVSDNQIGPDSTATSSPGLDWDRVYPLAGPIASTARSRATRWRSRSSTSTRRAGDGRRSCPGSGCSPDDFPDAYLRIFDLSAGDVTYLREDIAIPIEPFLGTMGVCPAGASAQPVMPPGNFGGNMDTRQLTRGHDAVPARPGRGRAVQLRRRARRQGDGEVCVTGLESPMYGALRFTLHKDRPIPAPQYLTSGPLAPRVADGAWYGTTGVGPDLFVGAQDAVRAMVDHLADQLRPLARGRLPALQPVRRPADLGDRRRRRVRRQRPAAVADLLRRVGLPGERRRTARAGRCAARRRGRSAHPARLRGQGAP